MLVAPTGLEPVLPVFETGVLFPLDDGAAYLV